MRQLHVQIDYIAASSHVPYKPQLIRPSLLVLRLLIRKRLPGLRELSKLVPNHILRYPHVVVDFPIVHLESETDEIG